MHADELSRREFLSICAAIGATGTLDNGSHSYLFRRDRELRIGIIDTSSNARGGAMASMVRGIELGIEEMGRTASMFDFALVTERITDASLDKRLQDTKKATFTALIGGGAEQQCVQFGDAARKAGILFIDTARRAHPLSMGKRSANTFRVAASAHMLATTMAGSLKGSPGQQWLLITESSGGEAIAQLVADRAKALGVRLTTEASADSDATRTRIMRLLADNDIDAVIFGQPYAEASDLLPIIQATRTGTTVVVLSGATTIASAEAPDRQLLMPAGWHSSLARFGAEQLNERFRARYQSEMDGPAWAGWTGMKILMESALRSKSTDPMKLREFLEAPGSRFDGHKGVSLSFVNHQLKQPLYVLESTTAGAPPRVVAESV